MGTRSNSTSPSLARSTRSSRAACRASPSAIGSAIWSASGRSAAFLGSAAMLALLIGGCSPTVKVEAPDKPIEINLNIKIEQNVRIRVDKELESLFDKKSDIF